MMSAPQQLSAFDRWQASFVSDKTKGNWTALMEKFCDATGVNHEQLFAERMATYTSQDPATARQPEERVKGYLKDLVKAGYYSPATIRTIFKAIKSFYNMATYEMAPLKISPKTLNLPKGGVVKSLPPTADDIETLLAAATARDRAMIAFMAETGWGPELVAAADIDWLDKTQGLPYIILRQRIKTNVDVMSFVGDRAAKYLDQYLRIRDAKEGPLFLNQDGLRMTPKRINEAIVIVAERAGINKKIHRGRNALHAYSLRHYFQTTMEDAKVPKNWIDRMMGHALDEVEGAYSLPRVLQMREAYIAAYPKLVPSSHAVTDVLGYQRQILKLLAAAGDKDVFRQALVELVGQPLAEGEVWLEGLQKAAKERLES